MTDGVPAPPPAGRHWAWPAAHFPEWRLSAGGCPGIHRPRCPSHFNVHMDGKITFEIHYEEGVLPEVFPEARTRVSRAARAVAKTTMPQPAEDEAAEKVETEATTEESHQTDEIPAENPSESITEETEPKGIEAIYDLSCFADSSLVAYSLKSNSNKRAPS